MTTANIPEILEEEIVSPVIFEESIKSLILYNDDVNTFDFVIEALVKVCKHSPLQAEQCAYLVHYTGKCVVKSQSFKVLRPLWKALLERGLSAQIED